MMVTIVALALLGALWATMLVTLEVGRRAAIRRRNKDPQERDADITAIEAAVYGLLGLLLAFTITGAATRFDHRRDLTIEETNAIGTAFHRLDLLPPNERVILQDCFRRYMDSRIEFYKGIQDRPYALKKLSDQQSLERAIWDQALASAESPGASADATRLLLPALNTMFDIRTTRTGNLFMHPPIVIFILLVTLALASSFLAGYEMAPDPQRNWLFAIIFTSILSISVYIVIDLEYPRYGLITNSTFDQLLVNLRAEMN